MKLKKNKVDILGTTYKIIEDSKVDVYIHREDGKITVEKIWKRGEK